MTSLQKQWQNLVSYTNLSQQCGNVCDQHDDKELDFNFCFELRWDCLWNFSIMILIALLWTRIPSGPDNFKRVIKVTGIRPLAPVQNSVSLEVNAT